MSVREVIARALLRTQPGVADWDQQFSSVQRRLINDADTILDVLRAAGLEVVPVKPRRRT